MCVVRGGVRETLRKEKGHNQKINEEREVVPQEPEPTIVLLLYSQAIFSVDKLFNLEGISFIWEGLVIGRLNGQGSVQLHRILSLKTYPPLMFCFCSLEILDNFEQWAHKIFILHWDCKLCSQF